MLQAVFTFSSSPSLATLLLSASRPVLLSIWVPSPSSRFSIDSTQAPQSTRILECRRRAAAGALSKSPPRTYSRNVWIASNTESTSHFRLSMLCFLEGTDEIDGVRHEALAYYTSDSVHITRHLRAHVASCNLVLAVFTVVYSRALVNKIPRQAGLLSPSKGSSLCLLCISLS